MKVVIIDDENAELMRLKQKLTSLFDDVEVVAECQSVSEAVKAIHKFQPQLVFTDIEMPGVSGLQLLDFFDNEDLNFELIFATSFSEYAVRAFQLSAIDYLLKPIDDELLKQAVEKVRKKQNLMQRERNAILKQNLDSSKPVRIALSMLNGVNFVSLSDIVLLKSDNVYTEVYIQKSEKVTVSKPLKEFEKILPKEDFFRNHRSYIVNMNCVKEYVTSEGGDLLMTNGMTVPIARDRKNDFLAMCKKIKI